MPRLCIYVYTMWRDSSRFLVASKSGLIGFDFGGKTNGSLRRGSLKKIGKGCFTFDTVSGILSEIFCPNGYLLKLRNFC